MADSKGRAFEKNHTSQCINQIFQCLQYLVVAIPITNKAAGHPIFSQSLYPRKAGFSANATFYHTHIGNTQFITDIRLKIHGKQFFKVIIYLPNLIMASAFAMLFFAMFSTNGPINSILTSVGWIKEPIDFLGSVFGTRSLVGLMNFLMWFGNTTIMLMAAIMGISPDIFEACELDGCTSSKRFFYITLPLIRPILAYTLITSIIGGLQMFDVPQILTNGQGNPDRTSMTLIMFLNSHLKSRNYGMAGALSVYLFIVSAILCFFVYKMTNGNNGEHSKKVTKKGK